MSVRHVQSTPAGLRAPDHCGVTAWPLLSEQQGLPRKVFRRSIAWLSGSLSTLRSAGYPRPTQDSLPAVGQTLLDGLVTRRVPMRGFRVLSTSHPPLPSLPGAIGSTERTRFGSAGLSVVEPFMGRRRVSDRSQGSHAAGSAWVAVVALPPLGGTTLVPIPRAGARPQGSLQGLGVRETLLGGLGQTS